MAGPVPTRAEDEDLLERLYLWATEGTGALRARYRVTNSQVQGMVGRTVRASDRIPCACRKPENRDGGMPARWWA